MGFKKYVLVIALLAFLVPNMSAQTPTPLPGTPQALTCIDFAATGVPVLNTVLNWTYLDRACIILENTTGEAIEIASIEAFFGLVSNPYMFDVRIWEIINSTYLPDLQQAGTQVSETYAFGGTVSTGEDVIVLRLDLENYASGSVPMPVINPGKKFVVEIMNKLDEPASQAGVKICTEPVG